jgi:hypothetical protein
LCQSSIVVASVCFTNEKINVIKCLAHRLLFQSFARLRFNELRRDQSSALPMACQGEVQKSLTFSERRLVSSERSSNRIPRKRVRIGLPHTVPHTGDGVLRHNFLILQYGTGGFQL